MCTVCVCMCKEIAGTQGMFLRTCALFYVQLSLYMHTASKQGFLDIFSSENLQEHRFGINWIAALPCVKLHGPSSAQQRTESKLLVFSPAKPCDFHIAYCGTLGLLIPLDFYLLPKMWQSQMEKYEPKFFVSYRNVTLCQHQSIIPECKKQFSHIRMQGIVLSQRRGGIVFVLCGFSQHPWFALIVGQSGVG